MPTFRFKQAKTPTNWAEAMALLDRLKYGDVVKDTERAVLYVKEYRLHAYWVTKRNEPTCNGADANHIGNATSAKFYELRDKHPRWSVLGIFDPMDLEKLKRRSIKLEDLTESESKMWKDLIGLARTKMKEQKMEFGVELELESDGALSEDREIIHENNPDIIQDVGSDCSVRGGTEIRFNHPDLKGWKLKTVAKVLDEAKAIGLKSEYGTAGMHIHVSDKNIEHITQVAKENKGFLEDVLYPISCRTKKIGAKKDHDAYFGVGTDIIKDQIGAFKTLEFRAWKATTNPKVFMARIRVTKAIVEYLNKLTGVRPIASAEEFFKGLEPRVKRDYLFLLRTENPHEFGFSPKVVMAMMN